MRITIVNGFFLPVPPVRGGATEKIWYRLAQEFAAAGHDVVFLSRTWPGFPAQETLGGVTHLRLRGADHTRSLALNLLLDLWWGLRVTRRLPPADAVICNTVALPVWLRRVKPAAGRVVAVFGRMPKGQARFYGGVDLLLAVSAAVRARLRAENPRLAGRIALFPNPIDWKLHARAAAQNFSDAPVTIGFVGRIHPEKGLGLLLAAAARLVARPGLPAWRLTLVGPAEVALGGGGADYRDSLVAEFGSVLGARLEFAGAEFDAEKLARRYGAMDMFCYPSLAEKGETFGIAVAEAMAAGCAPVVSGLACFADLVHDGDTGLVFDHAAPGADARLAEVLAQLIADPALRHAIAINAQAHVRRYDFSECARTVLADLTRLTAAAPAK